MSRTLYGILAGLMSSLVTALGAVDSEVVVYGATPGGIAAAVAAARSGAHVVLLEETRHVGGIVSSGLTNADIHNQAAVGGLFNEFKRRIREYYTATYGTGSEQVRDCQGGSMLEAHVAERMFNGTLAGAGERIRVVLRRRLVRVERNGARVAAVVVAALDDGGREEVYRARVFIDATYEGDLAALAGADYRVGREGREVFNEPHAGKIYVKFGSAEPLPGSTGEGDAGIQAFCFRFHLTTKPENRVPLEKLDGYDRDDYRHLLADICAGKVKKLRHAMQLRKMPNGKFEANSDHPHPDTGVPSESLDLAEENWRWPEADWRERKKIFRRYWSHNEGFLWFLQNDPEVPESLRAEASQYGFPKDEFTDNRHRPWQMYVREGRRIIGEYTFTELDAHSPMEHPDSIAVAEFPFDSHGVHKFDPAHPGVREGYFFIAHPPLDLPYGMLVPKKVDGLLVPVACSTSRVGYQAIRVEPVFMALGEAAGIAAQMAVAGGVEVRAVAVDKLRAEITRRGGVVHLDAGK